MSYYPPPPPPYQPQTHQPAVAVVYQPASTNGTAVFALIVSIGSWFLCPFVGAFLGGGLGLFALSEIRKRGQAGGGMAIASLIISGAHFLIYGVILLFIVLVVTGTCAGLSATPQ